MKLLVQMLSLKHREPRDLKLKAPLGTVVPEGGTALSSAVPLTAKEQQAEELRRRKEENIAKREERERQRQGLAGGEAPPAPAAPPQRFGGGIPGTQPATGVPRDELFATGRPSRYTEESKR